MGTNAIPWLLRWLQSEDRQHARLACRGFEFLRGEARPGLHALIELSQSSVPAIRGRTYSCLDALELDWDTIWLAIMPALHHSDPEVRERAAEFLMDKYPGQAQSAGVGDFVP